MVLNQGEHCTPGDIRQCLGTFLIATSERGCTAGSYRAEARNAATHSIMHGTALTVEDGPAQRGSGTKETLTFMDVPWLLWTSSWRQLRRLFSTSPSCSTMINISLCKKLLSHLGWLLSTNSCKCHWQAFWALLCLSALAFQEGGPVYTPTAKVLESYLLFESSWIQASAQTSSLQSSRIPPDGVSPLPKEDTQIFSTIIRRGLSWLSVQCVLAECQPTTLQPPCPGSSHLLILLAFLQSTFCFLIIFILVCCLVAPLVIYTP